MEKGCRGRWGVEETSVVLTVYDFARFEQFTQ